MPATDIDELAGTFIRTVELWSDFVATSHRCTI